MTYRYVQAILRFELIYELFSWAFYQNAEDPVFILKSRETDSRCTGRFVRNIPDYLYTFGVGDRLEKEIYLSDQWMEMINQNLVCILGWIQHEKLKWLQGINPEVSGLVYKFTPADEKKRKLSTVHELWDSIIELQPVIDIFTDNIVKAENMLRIILFLDRF